MKQLSVLGAVGAIGVVDGGIDKVDIDLCDVATAVARERAARRQMNMAMLAASGLASAKIAGTNVEPPKPKQFDGVIPSARSLPLKQRKKILARKMKARKVKADKKWNDTDKGYADRVTKLISTAVAA